MTAEVLRKQLESLGISAEELAAEMGMTARAVRWWRAGQRTIPKKEVTAALDRIVARREGYRRGRADAAEAATRAILDY